MHEKLINKLTDFIQFEREVRAATNVSALGFTVCNQMRKLLDYDVAVLLEKKGNRQRVVTISGVSDFDAQSPLVKGCEALCNHSQTDLRNTQVHQCESLPQNVAYQLSAIQINELLTASVCGNSTLVIVRGIPWQQHELSLVQQIAEVASHAHGALADKTSGSRFKKFVPGFRPDWRWAAVGLALMSFLPVPQSIMASAEVTARSPAVVAAGVNGVIEEIYVRPNEEVAEGQLLVRFDNTDLLHRQNTLEQELALAKERLRKARQHTLTGTAERSEFAELASQIELKQLELDYVQGMVLRLELRAATDGVAMFSRVQDWTGRLVSTGEKIMQIAAPDDHQFEIWVATNDSIDLNHGKLIKFFPDANPLEAVKGSVDTVGFFASEHADGEQLAYRVVADPTDNDDTLRLGMKGTARLYGEKVSLAYLVLRKPISAIRKHVGV